MKKVFLITCVILLAAGCHIPFNEGGGEYVSPSGSITKNERTVSDFTKISVSNGIELIVTPGNSHQLEIETYENLHQYIETELSGNTLTIKRQKGIRFKNSVVKAYVTVAKLNELRASGGSRITLTSTIITDQLAINGSGGCSLEGDVQCDNLNVELSGGGKAQMNFQCTSLKARTSGGGRLELSGSSEDADVRMSGGGKALLAINCQQLTTNTSGGGEINLSGSTDSYKLSASGGGRVKGIDMTVQTLSANMSGGGSAELTIDKEINFSGSGGGHLSYKGNAVTNHTSLSGGASIKKIN